MEVSYWSFIEKPSVMQDPNLKWVPKSRCTPLLIKPTGREHQVSLTCQRMQTYPGQMYPPLIKLSGTEHYYTRWVWHVEECRCTQVRCTSPTNRTEWYKALLHQVSLTCGRMQMYPGQMYPPLIKLSGTEHYYTRWVWHVEECRHTQVRCTPTPC